MPSTGCVGFIGLGVMGEPMCRNLAEKSDVELIGHDIRPEPLERLAAFGVMAADSVADVAARCDVIFLSLPAAEHVRTVCTGEAGLLTHCRAGTTVIDLSTVPPSLAQEFYVKFREQDLSFADAPVARSRHAAVDGTLSIMFGGDAEVLERVRGYLACIGTDITHIHPSASGEKLGEGTMRDFKLLCELTKGLDGGGVYVNVGSAVILPEVFLKAVSVVRNLGGSLTGFTTANLDFIQHYRPTQNVLKRPTQGGGQAIALTGHHEIMLPLIAAALKQSD